MTRYLLILAITALDQHLRTFMYLFLRNLSVLELCLISVTIPKSIHNSLTNDRSICFMSCVLQDFLAISSAFTELVILTVMFYDGYLAICHHLRYEVIMNRGVCLKMAAGSLLSRGLSAALHAVSTFSFYGSRVVGHFVCDIPQLLTISCSSDLLRQVVPIYINVTFDFCFFVGIVISYVLTMAPSYSSSVVDLLVSVFCKMVNTSAEKPRDSSPRVSRIGKFPGQCIHSQGETQISKEMSNHTTILDCSVPALNPFICSLSNRNMKVAMKRLGDFPLRTLPRATFMSLFLRL
ncbi:olfactory receptor 14A16-like [Tachyglossus aculeatus]|uniref:olfactory receptor 14A16-like n=1 Tax=Tachyglossus aculeatus TaxID=9261 RepID=UPI0018F4F12B|nr:olfactory receptor 14A16-like [Tachyglossus aculeatus]